ncbi:MAG: ATP-binding cassette domain-containing protein [Rikenellaceae bacterium]
MSTTNIIELKNASIYHPEEKSTLFGKRLKKGDLILSEVNLSLAKGEMIYLIGKVGSGKSSLLKTLYAESPLFEGEGTVDGYNLRKLKQKDISKLRRSIGVVFQNYQLLTDRNVFNNLNYVMKATGWSDKIQIRRKIEDVLNLVGLKNKEYKMPFELSGGEQQRLSIARAMINNPSVIIADEPTGNLDPAATDDIMKLFKVIVQGGCSIIMSTHNIGNIAQFPARTLRCNQGKLSQVNIESILGV